MEQKMQVWFLDFDFGTKNSIDCMFMFLGYVDMHHDSWILSDVLDSNV